MKKKRLYVIDTDNHEASSLRQILEKHPEIHFVSLAGVDLVGHETEEKIPIRLFMEDMDTFLNGIAIQTDGSSVYLPTIATLDNAKIDMKVDVDRNWFVDYNDEYRDDETDLPVGTLKIPCFLFHDGLPVDSRHALLNATTYFAEESKSLMANSPSFNKQFGFSAESIEKITITAATELEFWAMTPENHRDTLELATSQELHEQYWASTRGSVRTALEQTLDLMEMYGLGPEMGHKEVGGVKAKLSGNGSLTGVMEQLEVDWKYSDALQAADNEMLVKRIIKEQFRSNGMEVTFLAKPIDGVAGSGEHTHISVLAQTQSGEKINVLNPNEKSYLSSFGYGALMGILKNYEVINPFITSSNEAFKRLKKGFEAPICTVTSLGRTVDTPSRNRSVLIGLIRDEKNPFATRFELRSPNPHTNTYLCLTSLLLGMLDGINYALTSGQSEEQLLAELSKKPGDEAVYLEEGRSYRSEKDVFDDYSDEERVDYFGFVPSTVFENIHSFDLYPDKAQTLLKGNVLTKELLNSYKAASINKWVTELEHRIIPNVLKDISDMKALHHTLTASELDRNRWSDIDKLRKEVAKDTLKQTSVFTQIGQAIQEENLHMVSNLQKEMEAKLKELKSLYRLYKNNMID
ncbi:glutamine synthetase [Alkalibacterium iburiense]|uniref:Glutamine synthetase n=1 Tax=Alkalibacterium iburiense TaxID=290589 RepID=A0ABN0X9V3_9LACT